MYVWRRVKITPPGFYDTKSSLYSAECGFLLRPHANSDAKLFSWSRCVKVTFGKKLLSQACANSSLDMFKTNQTLHNPTREAAISFLRDLISRQLVEVPSPDISCPYETRTSGFRL